MVWVVVSTFSQPELLAQRSAWINYTQQYIKISTTSNGIHRVTFQQLSEASFPSTSVNTTNLQLFHRGQEQAIEVVDGGDGRLDAGDYLEFYGTQNDGALDVDLYHTPEAQPHAYYNLYSDTAAYFLTWANGVNGKRMPSIALPNPGTADIPYHWNQQLQLLTSDYSAGRRYPVGGAGATYRSQFDFGEGFTGTRIRNGSFAEFELETINVPFRPVRYLNLRFCWSAETSQFMSLRSLWGRTP